MRDICCEHCGVKFQGKRLTRKFCSKLCIQRSWQKRTKKEFVPKYRERPCASCGKLKRFYPNSGYKKSFCGVNCLRKYMLRGTQRPCGNCGAGIYRNPFVLKKTKMTFCSKKCKGKWMSAQLQVKIAEGYVPKHKINISIRRSKVMQDWRKAVFARDNWTCQDCGVRGTYIEADHIKPFAYFPELRTELSNGRTLCRPCHDKTKIGYRAMRKIYAS